jgi:hypothetical protein
MVQRALTCTYNSPLDPTPPFCNIHGSIEIYELTSGQHVTFRFVIYSSILLISQLCRRRYAGGILLPIALERQYTHSTATNDSYNILI